MFIDASQPQGQIVKLSDCELEDAVRKFLAQTMPGAVPLCVSFGENEHRGMECEAQLQGNFFSLLEQTP